MLLAHQGGWDELLLVAGPVAVIAALLVLADRRAKRALGDHPAPAVDDRPGLAGDDPGPAAGPQRDGTSG